MVGIIFDSEKGRIDDWQLTPFQEDTYNGPTSKGVNLFFMVLLLYSPPIDEQSNDLMGHLACSLQIHVYKHLAYEYAISSSSMTSVFCAVLRSLPLA